MAEASEQARYRLVIADDQSDARKYIRKLVSAKHDVLGEISDGGAVAEWVRTLRPDILLLDISMPVLSGFAVIRQLAKEGTPVKVVFVTYHDEPAYLAAARNAGAGDTC